MTEPDSGTQTSNGNDPVDGGPTTESREEFRVETPENTESTPERVTESTTETTVTEPASE